MKKSVNHQAMLADLLLRFVIDHFDEYSSDDATHLYNYWIESQIIPRGLTISEEEHRYLFPLCDLFLAGDIEKLKLCRDAQDELNRLDK